MEASGSKIPSTVHAPVCVHQAGFSDNPPSLPSKDIITGIFQLIQLRNLGTMYCIQWCSHAGSWGLGKTVFDLVPHCWDRGY